MHFKKLLSTGLSIVMALSMLPTAALAADTDPSRSNSTVEYVLMNIPYADFYKNELVNNSIPVDGFTSATLNKTRTASLVAGSYHVNSDGTDITGITYPVKVDAGVDLSQYKEVTDSDSVTISVTNRGNTSTTTYTGKEALFENSSYAYYVLDKEPSYYKEATTDADGTLSFSKVAGTASTPQTVSGITTKFTTDSTYGDYQLDLSGVTFNTDTVYAVVLTAVDSNGTETSYGLRHMENVWRGTALSWCTGFTTAVHNCTTSSTPYISMMGQTIKKVTYYTSEGLFEMSVDNYVPVKFENTFEVADSASGTGTANVTLEGLPSDFAASYSIEKGQNTYDAQVENGVLSYSNLSPGSYTLRASDTSGTYADITTSFVLSTTQVPVEYDSAKTALVSATGHTSTELAEYISGISSVSVNGKSYSASGRGAVQIIQNDGTIDLTASSNGTAIFGSDGDYTVTVSSTGYPDYGFTVTIKTTQPDTPSTEDTSTQAPSTETPSTQAPSTEKPSTQAPTTETPSTQTPSTEKPSTQAPTTETPSTQTPSTEKPSTQAPTTTTTKAVSKTYGGKAFSVKKSGATYKSSNPNVITVSKAGKATIKGVGKTVITVKTKTKTTKTTYVVKPGKIASKSIKVVNNASKKLKVTWKKKAGLGLTAKKAYYQIQYSTSKKFTKKTTKTLTVKGSASSKTISKLKKGKTYYVRMRGYDKANKKTGSWSTVKKVKIKK